MEQKIVFQNPAGDKLVGILNTANHSNPVTPVVIICHGLFVNMNGSASTIAERLAAAGIASFRFDFWGHGASEGNFENITISEGVADILAAIKLLNSKGYTNIALMGLSFGGACAIMVAAQVKTLKALGLRSPVADYAERTALIMSPEQIGAWKIKGFRIYTGGNGKQVPLNYSFFEDFQNNKGYEAAKEIKIPTCIVHGDKDIDVPISLSDKLARTIPQAEYHVVTGADHRYSTEAFENEGITILVNFFKTVLQ